MPSGRARLRFTRPPQLTQAAAGLSTPVPGPGRTLGRVRDRRRRPDFFLDHDEYLYYTGIMGRAKVDLVEKESLRNPYRRHSILSSRQVLYAA